eukprot:359300-Chlamydomonas_euryale.AAC.1
MLLLLFPTGGSACPEPSSAPPPRALPAPASVTARLCPRSRSCPCFRQAVQPVLNHPPPPLLHEASYPSVPSSSKTSFSMVHCPAGFSGTPILCYSSIHPHCSQPGCVASRQRDAVRAEYSVHQLEPRHSVPTSGSHQHLYFRCRPLLQALAEASERLIDQFAVLFCGGDVIKAQASLNSVLRDEIKVWAGELSARAPVMSPTADGGWTRALERTSGREATWLPSTALLLALHQRPVPTPPCHATGRAQHRLARRRGAPRPTPFLRS